jgi:hypothetical protein
MDSIDSTQLNRLLPQDRDRVQSPNRYFKIENKTMDNFQKLNNFNSVLIMNNPIL